MGLLATAYLASLLATGVTAAPPAAPVTALAVSRDTKVVLTGSQAGICTFDWPSLKAGAKMPTTMAHVHDLAFSPSGDWLAAVGGSPAERGQIDVYSWPERELIWRKAWSDDVIYDVDFSPDGRSIATADGARRVAVWNLEESEERVSPVVFSGHFGRVTAVKFLPAGHGVVSAATDQSLRLWSIKSGPAARVLDNHTGAIHALAVCPRRDLARPLIASVAADRTVRFWQPTIGRMARFARLDAEPLCLAWLGDGIRVAVGCSDGHVRVVDSENAAVVKDIPASEGRLYSIASLPVSDCLIAGCSGSESKIIAVLLE